MATKDSPTELIDPEIAAITKSKAQAVIDRSDNVVLRDDPEAKAAFLATFTPEEEKAIMRKVDKRFFILIGLMYMIKQVRFHNTSKRNLLLLMGTRSMLSMLPASRCFKSASLATF